MATRNKLIEAMSPVITKADSLEMAQQNFNGLIVIAKKFGGYIFSKPAKLEESVYGMQLAFTNLEMYQHYLVQAKADGLL